MLQHQAHRFVHTTHLNDPFIKRNENNYDHKYHLSTMEASLKKNRDYLGIFCFMGSESSAIDVLKALIIIFIVGKNLFR